MTSKTEQRRTMLKKMGMAAGAAIISPISYAAASQEAGFKEPKKVLTLAHITDVHIRPEHNAPQRFKQCLQEIKKHKVDFFLNGGDSIYAADYDHITRERTLEQWQIWHELRKEIGSVAMHSCLGNHDMWWAAPNKADAMYGKAYAVKQLGTPNRYYSFDQAGWHFIILDGNNDPYGALDAEQMQWLKADLASLRKGAHVLVMSHYPIVGVNGGTHNDRKLLTDLFYTHKDKKISCFSGHVHLLESVVYNGVNYFGNGAMSGFWWEDGDEKSKGKYWVEETPPGYAIVELFDDGLVKNTYYPYAY